MPKLYDYFGLDFFVYNIEFAPEKITKKL